MRNFYISTVGIIFVMAMLMQIPAFNINSQIKIIVFVAWAAYGVLPTMHWAVKMGGFQNTMVSVSISFFVCFFLIIQLYTNS